MKIKSIHVRNYKSWSNSNEIILARGLNIIVGQNNAGKTALLEAIGLKAGCQPHMTILSKPESDSFINQRSTVFAVLEFEENELLKTTKGLGQQFYIPYPQERVLSSMELDADIVHRLSQRQTISFELVNGDIADCKFEASWYSPNRIYLRCQIDPESGNIHYNGTAVSEADASGHALPRLLIHALRNRVYLMRAERYNVSSSPISSSHNLLEPNCSNLSQVLHNLHSTNRTRFMKLVRWLTKVFPTIKDVSVPVNGGQTTIMVWPIEPEEERVDLAIPLSNSGTGIGQVLAMLYLIVSSDTPQCILIDEPQSFLHPGAMRAFIEILSLNTKHQYIITTHSPHILNTNSVSVVHVTYDGIQSVAKVLSSRTAEDARLMLQDVGFKMSDVFGADKILWVEGATEEECFKLIVQMTSAEPLWGIEIAGVRATGDLEGRHSALVFAIYQKLSAGIGIIPPAVAFIFDRESRSPEEIVDMKRTGNGRIYFLARQMFENYLVMHVDAIADVLNSYLDGRSLTGVQVNEWIKENGSDRKYIKNSHLVGSEDWLADVHGAKLLKDMFSSLSDNEIAYDKVKHGYRLTKAILERDRSAFSEILQLINTACNL
jgi:predicted ATPase